MPIAAGTKNVVIFAAVGALVDGHAADGGAARPDGSDHLAVLGRHLICELFKIQRRIGIKYVFDGWHGETPAWCD